MNCNTKYTTETKPLVTVIIPTHNSSSYIEKTISSVIQANVKFALEIILVDDTSSDIEKLKLIAYQNTSTLIIEKKEKTNAADSRNIGLKAANGDYIFFLDSDDCFEENHIQRRVDIHKSSNCGLIFGNYIERNNNIDIKKNIPIYTSNDIRDYIFSVGGDVRSSTISICKKSYKGTTFDARQFKHQDWGYAIRAYDQDENIIFDHGASVIIDNTQNTHRMSNQMNTSASEYFLSEYISNPEHIISFAKGHFKLSIITEDKKGLKLLRNILIPTLTQTPFRKKIKVGIICLATLPLICKLTKLIFILRKQS